MSLKYCCGWNMMEWSFKNATTRKDMPRLSENHQLMFHESNHVQSTKICVNISAQINPNLMINQSNSRVWEKSMETNHQRLGI